MGVRKARLGEALFAQEARVASAAGSAGGVGVVTAVSQREVDAVVVALADDLGLGEPDERRVEGEGRAGDGHFRREVVNTPMKATAIPTSSGCPVHPSEAFASAFSL